MFKFQKLKALLILFLIGIFYCPNISLAQAQPRHAIAMHGSPKYPANFTHFSYVNPNAPKGGILNLGIQGTYTSLNPLNIRGGAAAGVRGYLYESLLARALDEPFTLYGLIAKAIEVPEDRSFITFTLRPEAKFSDGKPITVDDIIFSHTLLRDHGRPNHRTYYSKVIKVTKIGSDSVKFTFDKSGDREMPLIMGLMPIMPKHAMNETLFKETSLTPPVGSGPYRIVKVDAGKQIVYQLNPDYWGQNLSVNKGRFNFETIKFTYYRDANTLFEAFKKGLHDIQYESDPGKWSTAYNFRKVTDKKVLKKQFSLKIPSGMSALVFNSRRKVFADHRVRKALQYLFNFEGINRKLYHGLYTRTKSYFDRSALASYGHSASTTEEEMLGSDFLSKYPEISKGTHEFPKNRTGSLDRRNIRKAIKLLKSAGYQLNSGVMINQQTKQPLSFEILIASSVQEPMLLNFVGGLKQIGIEANIRLVDSTQYQKRKISFDFDMIQNTWTASLSPGNEQLFRWSSKQAANEGSFNFAGVQDPAVDNAITTLLSAKEPDQFTASVRSLDRLLLAGDYVIPLFHLKGQWLAHWAYLGHPDTDSFYGSQLDTWWYKGSE